MRIKVIILTIFLSTSLCFTQTLYNFEDELDPRRLNWVYVSLERLSVKCGIQLPTAFPYSKDEIITILNKLKPHLKDEYDFTLINAIEKEIKKERKGFSFEGHEKSIFMGTDIGSRSWLDSRKNYELLSLVTFWLARDFGTMSSGYTDLTFFNEQKNLKDTIPYYDPVIEPNFILYNWEGEDAPVLGTKKYFEVKVDKAYGIFNLSWGRIEIGRDKVRWGPGYRSALFLSGFSLPFDYLYNIKSKIGNINLYVFNASIQDPLELKRIAAQRIEICLGEKLRIGFTEGVLHTKNQLLKYFNPFNVYFTIERHGISPGNDNLVLDFDFSIVPCKGVKLWFEFLDDDYLVFSKLAQPNQYGFLAGFLLTFPQTDLRAEAVYVNPWTYAHRSDTTHLTYNGIPLGFWGGSDVIDFYLELIRHLSPNLELRLSYENFVHGALGLEDRWVAADTLKFPNPRSVEAPTGRADRRNIFGIEVLWHTQKFSLSAGVWESIIKNYGNSDESFNRLRAKLSLNIFI
ncbi:hypothetical protein KAW65_03305 [candidate division WOR-3 bacterium]|nr:hypothetical protein [candidate division WOR-3 bacterium]